MRRRFNLPTESAIGNVYIHSDATACSRCAHSLHAGQIALWRSPYHILKSIWRCLIKRTDILVGKMEEIPPTACGRIVCYGDCTRELAERHNLAWIPGCPPPVKEHLELY